MISMNNEYKGYFKYSFFLMAFVMPGPISILRITLAVWMILLLIEYAVSPKTKEWSLYKTLSVLFLCYFFWMAFCMILHQPFIYKPLENRASLFLLPLIFLLRTPQEEEKKYFIKGFILGNCALGIVNILQSIVVSTTFANGHLIFDSTVFGGISVWESIDHIGNYFFSFHFSRYIHPSYWALYLTISISLIWLFNPFENTKPQKVLVILFLLLIIFMCSSRAGIFGITFALFILLIKTTKPSRPFYKIISLIFLVALLTIFFLNPRMTDLAKSFQDDSYKLSQRVQCWIIATDVIDHNFLGKGLQHTESALLNEYKRNGLVEHYDLQLNAHNQFLETTLNSGYLGLLLLLLILGFSAYVAVKQNNTFSIIVILNLLLHFSFESMLTPLHGMMFFTIFLLLFISDKSKVNTTILQ
jgi:O-antigen ligase